MAQELGICHPLAMPCQLAHLAPLCPARQPHVEGGVTAFIDERLGDMGHNYVC